MPAGEAVAPGRGPAHDVFGRGLLPEGEVVGVVLIALTVELARVGHDVLEVAARQAAVVVAGVVLLDIEVDRAVRHVGKPGVENPLDEGNLLDDVARGAGLDGGRLDVERLHGVVVALRIVVGHLHRFELLEARLLGDFVLTLVGVVFQMAHVGDVAHVAHLVARSLQVAEQQVEGHGRTGMAQMGVAVDRGAADIHPHATGGNRLEHLLAAGERIVKHEFGIHSIGIFCYKNRKYNSECAQKTAINPTPDTLQPFRNGPLRSDARPQNRPRRWNFRPLRGNID